MVSGHLIHPDKTKGPDECTSQALLELQALESYLETGSRGFRSGQLCLYISMLPVHSGMDLLSSACTAHTAQVCQTLTLLLIVSWDGKNILFYCFHVLS